VLQLEKEVGLRFVGIDDSGKRMEIVELDGYPFFVDTQYHPEFKSRPGRSSPPFMSFILAAACLPLDTMRGIREQDPWAERGADVASLANGFNGVHILIESSYC
jgi:Glutamine amidotransferase class-I